MSLLSIGEVLVDSDVLTALFSCNLHECRGACCVEGELGAPLSVAEAEQLQQPPQELLRMLPEKALRYLRRFGTVELYQGVHYTKTLHERECVFAFQQDGITFCAIERACFDGIIDFNKPISCRLFPIRIRKKFGLDYLVYEQHSMCRTARAMGKECGVQLIEYVASSLESLYGKEWLEQLRAYLKTSSAV